MPSSPKITSSRELAKLAGVSHMTVSRAFRNDPSISEATRERILELAAKHGYQPNPIHTLHMRKKPSGQEARSAKGSIAFIHNNFQKNVPKSSWKYVAHNLPILEGMEAQAATYGFALDEFYVGHEPGGISPTRLNGILKARGILGVIVGPPTHAAAYEGIDWDHHVGVTLTHREYPPYLPRVSFDSLHTVASCLQELQSLGYKRIGLSIPAKHDSSQLHVWSGCLLMHHRMYPCGMKDPLFSYPSPNIKDVVDDFYAWVDEQKPDAIICIDRYSRELLQAKGIRVPQDIALAHSAVERDVADWSGYKIDRSAQGRATVDLLMSRMIHNEFGIPASSTETLLRGQWQHGSTSRPPG